MSPTNSGTKTRKRETSASDGNAVHRSTCPVLSFGYGEPELTNKHEALVGVGFKVKTVSDFETVKTLISEEGLKYKILLIGRLVPQPERETLSKLYRQYCPDGNLILFYRDSIRETHGAAAVLSERHSPANLLDAISAIQSRRE